MWRWTIAILGASAVGAGVALLSSGFGTDEPLMIEGDRVVDLGVVRFKAPATQMEHRFELINRTTRTLRVQRIALSCGCLDATCPVGEWPPGASRNVMLRLTLRDFGRRSADASLIIENEPPVPLTLSAIGCPDQALKFADGDVRLDAEGTATFKVRLFTLNTHDSPIPPLITTEPSVTSEFLGWTKELDAQTADGIAGRFVGEVHIQATSEVDRTKVRLEMGGAVLERMLSR